MLSAKSAVVAGSVLLAASLALNFVLLLSRGDPPAAAVKPAAAAPEQPGRSPILFDRLRWDDNQVTLQFKTNGSPLVAPDRPVLIAPAVRHSCLTVDDEIQIRAEFQPETVYTFTVAAGLANQRGDRLPKAITVSRKIPARPPLLRFLAAGLYLPLKSPKLEFLYVSQNVAKVRVRLLKAYENNLNPGFGSGRERRLMQEVAATEIILDVPRNAAVNQALDLDRLLPKREPGVYRLELADPDHWMARTECDFVLTDLGIQTVLDRAGRRAAVFVRSLADRSPAPDAGVTILSRKNQLVARGVTGPDGAALLDWRPDFDDRNDSVAGVLVKTVADISYFELDHPYFDGEEQPWAGGRPNAFVFADRGVCRPGESVEVSLFVRELKAGEVAVPGRLPAICSVYDPQGKLFERRTVMLDRYGYAGFEFKLPADAALGAYRIACGNEPEWGSTRILAAQYVPDQFKISLKSESAAGPAVDFAVRADYYFGVPLANGEVNLLVNAGAGPNPAFWPRDWTVGDRSVFRAPRLFSAKGRTDADGDAVIRYAGFAAEGGSACGPVRLSAVATVSEPGGRGVSAYHQCDYFPTDFFIGLAPDAAAAPGDAAFGVRLLPARDDPAARLAAPLEIRFELDRLEWEYVLTGEAPFRREWRQVKIPQSGCDRVIKVPTGSRLADFRARYDFAALPEGCYQLRALAAGPPLRTAIEFFHARGESGRRSGNPAELVFLTDAEQYRPGATAQVTFDSPGDGEALLVEGEFGLAGYRLTPVRAGRNTITVPIPATARTSSYFAGITLLTAGPGGPARSFGLLTLAVDQRGEHQLTVKLDAPAVAVPGDPVKIRVGLTDRAGRPQAGLVKVYAVDEGVLALTDYRTPDIYDRFFGRFGVPLDFGDVYGEIYPELRILPDGRIGGDSGGGLAAKRGVLPAKAVARLLLNAAVVPESGEIELAGKLPDHLGALRLMAVAANATKAGSAEREIILRDRIGATVGAPRFLAPGDRAEFTFTLFNFDLEAGAYRFAVTLPPTLAAVAAEPVFTGKLVKGQPVTVTMPVRALAAGAGELKWELTLGSEVKKGGELLTVRPVQVRQTRSETVAVPPGKSAAFAPDPVGWEPGAASRLVVANSPAANLAAALDWLNTYPYGCCEQTVAAAFPFLILDELVKGKVIAPEAAEAHRHKVAAAYARLLAMRLADGSFAMWPGGTEEWTDGTLFAAHFIFAGVDRQLITPDEAVLRPLRRRLRQLAADASAANRMRRAYAVYVLAAAGDEAFVNPARNLLSCGQTDYASFLAALALVRGGYAAEGAPALDEAVRARVWLEPSGLAFATPASQLGMTLYILLDNNFRDEAVLARLAAELSRQLRRDGSGWGTTQANAWASLGLGAYAGRYPAAPLTARLAENGATRQLRDGESFQLAGPVTVTNAGTAPLTVTRIVSGIPRNAPAEAGRIKLKKEFFDRSGKVVDTVDHGDLVFVRLTVASTERVADVVIADLLPAGLAIEDELLATRSALLPPAVRAKYGALRPKLVEKGDDRFLLFGDLEAGTAQFTYRTRAVTRGVFTAPPVQAEAMYDPDLNGVADPGGALTVK